jgi:Clr5 domain
MDQPDSSKMTRLDKQFGDCKEEIRRVYCVQDKPLRETMDFFAQKRGLNARYGGIPPSLSISASIF